MSTFTSYHENLRELYSEILQKEINSQELLMKLSVNDRQILFKELTHWFGASPPETKTVQLKIKKIIENDLDYTKIEE